MSREWLNTQSFERAHQLVSAINTVSIHTKLKLLGIDDRTRLAEVQKARKHIARFLEDLEPVLREVEADPGGIAMGADSRFNDLARRIARIRRQRPQTSRLAALSLAKLRKLLESDDPEDLKAVVECLRDLRHVVEEHAYVDVVTILGEI